MGGEETARPMWRKKTTDEPLPPPPFLGAGVPVWRIFAVIVAALLIYGVYTGCQNLFEMWQDASWPRRMPAESLAKVTVVVAPPGEGVSLYYTIAFPKKGDARAKTHAWYVVDAGSDADSRQRTSNYDLPDGAITREEVAAALNDANFVGMVERCRGYAMPSGQNWSVSVWNESSDWYPLYASPWAPWGSLHTRGATRSLLRALMDIVGSDPVISARERDALIRLAARLD